MRILWVCPTLLHPTINGSQIRTLGILRHLRRTHDIDFVGLGRRDQTTEPHEEYCSDVHAFVHEPPRRGSLAFAVAAALNLFSPLPLNVARYASRPARERVASLLASKRYDVVVVDFLLSVPNVPSLENAVLFQHNIEGRIMDRLAADASSPVRRLYLRYLTRRLSRYEASACQRVKRVITVSATDAEYISTHYGVRGAIPVPTGVDVEWFSARPAIPAAPYRDLIFVGSLDYLPNVEGIRWFAERVLPIIFAARPGTTIALVGKNPVPLVARLAERDGRIHVTGTVPDVRPYLWNAAVSIVPVLAGSGTRLKIYEAMAAGVPVVSTTIGAEGLECTRDVDIALADDPQTFADTCLTLLSDPARRIDLARAGRRLVEARFDWSRVAAQFEAILDRTHSGLRSHSF